MGYILQNLQSLRGNLTWCIPVGEQWSGPCDFLCCAGNGTQCRCQLCQVVVGHILARTPWN